MTAVIVVGGGHNGLVAACKLARAGARVTVVERASAAGGLCRPIEFAPGYVVPGVFHDLAFDPKLITELALGLEQVDPPTTWIDGSGGLRSVAANLADVAGAEAWRGFIDRLRPFAREIFTAPPPPLLPTSTSEFWKLGRTGLGLRRLGRTDMTELLRVPPMCAADWVNEHFADDPALAEWIASAGVLHDFAGPWSAGTAANLLLASMLRGRSIRGGGAGLIAALVAACERDGVAIRTGTRVVRIAVESGRATGVALGDGEFLKADVVLATCDPRTAMLDLVDAVHLPMKVEQQFMSIRARGTTAWLMLALDGAPKFSGAPDAERLYLGGGSLDGLERAFDAVKYGEFSQRPVLDVAVPTIATPELAPAGHHVVSVLASFVPYELRAGWTETSRADLQQLVLTRLAEYAPTLRDQVVTTQLWTPVELEQQFGVNGGCLHHVEHALDQLFFMRPTPSTARYASPIAGLYLGGSGNHPCGGVTGLPGMLAANEIMKVLSR